MLGSASPIYEIVSGQIKLGKNAEFAKAHEEILLPICKDSNIEIVLMLVTETGMYGHFYNIYRYNTLKSYGENTDAFIKDTRVSSYFAKLMDCIDGPLQVELATDLISHKKLVSTAVMANGTSNGNDNGSASASKRLKNETKQISY